MKKIRHLPFVKIMFFMFALVIGIGNIGDAMEITIEIKKNPEFDIDHYVVYWGNTPRSLAGETYPNNSGNLISASFPFKYTIAGLDGGTSYYIAVKAVDILGQESPFSTELTSFFITDPKNGFYINAQNSSSFTVTGKGITGDEVNIDVGGTIYTGTVDLSANWTISLDYSSSTDGPITITATAGARALSSSVSGTLDKTPPSPPANLSKD